MTAAPSPIRFHVVATDGAGRAGLLETPHGRVETPAFMPVGTAGTVKGVTPAQLRELGAEIVLANTYHLALRPGPAVIAAAGGLHRFMAWDGPILTDSGGFQVFSLAASRRVDDEGVLFRSHVDGREVLLTPESATEIQEQLGADIIMAFDECPGNPCSPDDARRAVERTVAWAGRCLRAKRRDDQALFGIQQGALDSALRLECTERLLALDLPGYAVGGLAVGEPRDAMVATLAVAARALPPAQPRYLMGVGPPADLLDAIALGCDLFDCVIPTRNARNTCALTHAGRMNLRNNKYREDFRPLEDGCDCYACRSFSRAYLRHLFQAGEMLAGTLTTIHNLRFYHRFLAEARAAIRAGRFAELRRTTISRLRAGGEAEPASEEGEGGTTEGSTPSSLSAD